MEVRGDVGRGSNDMMSRFYVVLAWERALFG